MRAPVMTGHTSDRRYGTLVVLVEMEEFFIDLLAHLVHVTGDILFRFGVAGEVEVMRGAVGGRRVTEVAMDAKRLFPRIHRFVEIVMTDILWQHFQISLWRFVIGRTHGGHPDDGKGSKYGNNGEFFVMQHSGDVLVHQVSELLTESARLFDNILTIAGWGRGLTFAE